MNILSYHQTSFKDEEIVSMLSDVGSSTDERNQTKILRHFGGREVKQISKNPKRDLESIPLERVTKVVRAHLEKSQNPIENKKLIWGYRTIALKSKQSEKGILGIIYRFFHYVTGQTKRVEEACALIDWARIKFNQTYPIPFESQGDYTGPIAGTYGDFSYQGEVVNGTFSGKITNLEKKIEYNGHMKEGMFSGTINEIDIGVEREVFHVSIY